MRVLSIAIRAPLGCFGFVCGMVTVLSIALPTMLDGRASQWVEFGFAEAFEGDLRFGETTLSWFGTQSFEDVELFAPDGELVASVSATTRGLVPLMERGFQSFGQTDVEARVALVRYEDGTWNFERALTLSDSQEEPEFEISGGGRDLFDYEGELTLRIPMLTIEDRMAGGPDRKLRIGDVSITVDQSYPAGRIEGSGKFLDTSWASDFEFQLLYGEEGILDYSVEMDSVPIDWIDGFVGGEGLLVAAFGDMAGLRIGQEKVWAVENGSGLMSRPISDTESPSWDPDGVGSKIDFWLGGLQGQLIGNAILVGGALRIASPDEIVFVSDAPGRLLDAFLPPGAKLDYDYDFVEGDSPARISLTSLDLPLAGGFGPLALGPGLGLEGAIRAGGIELTPRGGGAPLFLVSATGSFGMAPGARPTVDLRGSIGGAEDMGELELMAIGDPVSAMWLAVDEGRRPGVDVQLGARSLPAWFVDHLLSTDGLVETMFGGALEMSLGLRSSESSADVGLTMDLDSPSARAVIEATVDSAGVVTAVEPSQVTFLLNADTSETFATRLLPLHRELEPTEEGQRVNLELSEFAIPTDGDPRLLDGRLRARFGPMDVIPLNGLDEDLWTQTAGQGLGAYEFEVESGRLIFEGMALPGLRPGIEVSGSTDLATREVALSARLPLSLFEGDGESLVDPSRWDHDFVPVSFAGRWPDVWMTVDLPALEQLLVEETAELEQEALERKMEAERARLEGLETAEEASRRAAAEAKSELERLIGGDPEDG